MAKKAIVVATRESRWHVQRGTEQVLVEFAKGDEIEIGKDVPAGIAAEMVQHGYAVDPEAEAKAKAKAKADAEAQAAAAKAKKAAAATNPAAEHKNDGDAAK